MAGQWYVGLAGGTEGPLSSTQLRGLVAQGRVVESTQIWREGMSGWVAAGSIAGLFPQAAGSAATSRASDASAALAPRQSSATPASTSLAGQEIRAAVEFPISELRNERVVGLIEATKFDLGLAGMLLGHRMVLVVTSRRILFTYKKLLSRDIGSLDLDLVQSISTSRAIRTELVSLSVLCLFGAITLATLPGSVLAFGSNLLVAGILLALALVAALLSRRKVIEVSASTSSVRLPLTRSIETVTRFMNATWGAIDARRSQAGR